MVWRWGCAGQKNNLEDDISTGRTTGFRGGGKLCLSDMGVDVELVHQEIKRGLDFSSAKRAELMKGCYCGLRRKDRHFGGVKWAKRARSQASSRFTALEGPPESRYKLGWGSDDESHVLKDMV